MSEKNYRFIDACWRKPVDYTPIWIMRQAGRYMKEYQDIRNRVSFLELCKTPELAVEVTLLPIDKLGVDAAILFSDILIPVEAMGMDLEFGDGGPHLGSPVKNKSDVDKLIIPEPEEKVPFVMETIKLLRRELEGRVPLIGFSGAPFTLASYMVEGGGTSSFVKIKTMMFKDPETIHALLDKVAKTVIHYLNAQIKAGAQAVQIFDSWAGTLSPRDYQEFALRYTKQVIDGLNRKNIPVIYFVQGNPGVLELVKQAGSDVIGVDWRINLDTAWSRLGYDVAVQGNLEPCALFLPKDKLEERAKEVLDQAGSKPGHIFNLGHGILPQASVENAKFLVEAVHRYGVRR